MYKYRIEIDLIWWFVWFVLFSWIFTNAYQIPFQRRKKISALDIIEKLLESGQISEEEYQLKKKSIENKVRILKY